MNSSKIVRSHVERKKTHKMVQPRRIKKYYHYNFPSYVFVKAVKCFLLRNKLWHRRSVVLLFHALLFCGKMQQVVLCSAAAILFLNALINFVKFPQTTTEIFVFFFQPSYHKKPRMGDLLCCPIVCRVILWLYCINRHMG